MLICESRFGKALNNITVPWMLDRLKAIGPRVASLQAYTCHAKWSINIKLEGPLVKDKRTARLLHADSEGAEVQTNPKETLFIYKKKVRLLHED